MQLSAWPGTSQAGPACSIALAWTLRFTDADLPRVFVPGASLRPLQPGRLLAIEDEVGKLVGLHIEDKGQPVGRIVVVAGRGAAEVAFRFAEIAVTFGHLAELIRIPGGVDQIGDVVDPLRLAGVLAKAPQIVFQTAQPVSGADPVMVGVREPGEVDLSGGPCSLPVSLLDVKVPREEFSESAPA